MSIYSANELLQQGKTVITAHSGCEGTPDNSMEHIYAAIASGAEMLEVDLRMSPDGTLYLSHDVPENIAQRPLLSDLFSILSATDRISVNLDVKTEGLIAPAMKMARNYHLTDRILFTGSCTRDRALAVSLGADIWRNLETGESVQDGMQHILQDGSPCLNVRHTLITDEFHQRLRECGRGFSAWTVNDEDNMRRLLQVGVANITTRHPVLAVKLRKEIQGI